MNEDQHQDQAPAAPETDVDLARRAFIHAVCSNLGMLAVVLAVNLAIAKRDAITRTVRRMSLSRRQAARQAAINRAVSEFRGELDEITHAVGGLLDDEP